MIRFVTETGSTNADLLALAHSGEPEGTWLRAGSQTSGRGRLERTWLSPPGNLYASTIVRPLGRDPGAPTLALVAAVALEEVASAYAGDGKLQLKWPNDLMAGQAKLAGILLERGGDAVVIGFGVNLAHHPAALDRPTTSLAALGCAAPDPAAFVVELADAFARWLARWRGEGLTLVRGRWLEKAHPVGTAISATTPAGAVNGLFAGLDADGALLLRRADGRIELVHAGDVFLL